MQRWQATAQAKKFYFSSLFKKKLVHAAVFEYLSA